MESKNLRINVVIYTESKEESSDLATDLFAKEYSEDVWMNNINGVATYGYIRWPNCLASSSPSGITDILIVKLNSDSSEHWETVLNYVDTRRGIPFKFLTSAEDLSAKAKELGAEFIPLSEITGDEVGMKILKSALDLEQTLGDTFCKLDVDQDGFITSSEIMDAAKSLGHPLNDEDAKEITKSLSTDGKISFDKFKQWWVMGRTDFASFRRVVEMEMVVHNLVHQSSNAFNSYLDKVKQEGAEFGNTEDVQVGRLNIKPQNDFESGISLNLHLTVGNEYNGIAESFPSNIRSAPASFGLELRLKKEEDGKSVIETLSGLKEMLMSVEKVESLIQAGLAVNFRHVGCSVFVDVSAGGMVGDKLGGLLSMFNIAALNFTVGNDVHVTNQLSPVDLLDKDLRSLIESLCNVKIESKGEYAHMKNLINFFVNLCSTNPYFRFGQKQKPFLFILKAMIAIRKLDFSLIYDPKVVIQTIIDMINEKDAEGDAPKFITREKEWTNEKQAQIKAQFDYVSEMGKQFLEPFLPSLLAVDLDNISVYATCPVLKAHAKVTVMIRGISNLVSTTFA